MAESKKFQAKCFYCKDKDKVTLDNGMSFTLPYKTVELKKDNILLKECKEYVKESKEKYKSEKVIKRAIYNGCPECGHTIVVGCKDYVDFYSPKKKIEKKEEEEETTETFTKTIDI